MSMFNLTKGEIEILRRFLEKVNNDSVNGKINIDNILTYSENLKLIANCLELIIFDMEKAMGEDNNFKCLQQQNHQTERRIIPYKSASSLTLKSIEDEIHHRLKEELNE
jgi:hypothetical protein